MSCEVFELQRGILLTSGRTATQISLNNKGKLLTQIIQREKNGSSLRHQSASALVPALQLDLSAPSLCTAAPFHLVPDTLAWCPAAWAGLCPLSWAATVKRELTPYLYTSVSWDTEAPCWFHMRTPWTNHSRYSDGILELAKSEHLSRGLNLLFEEGVWGTSLVVQWLRLCTPNAGALGLIPGQGTRSHMLQLRLHFPQLNIPHAKYQRSCVSQPRPSTAK